MYKEIRQYVERLFQNAPGNIKVEELKEELIANLCDKYTDLVKEGISEENAYNTVISSIGDVEEMVGNVNLSMEYSFVEEEEKRKAKNGIFISVSVGLYIASVAIFFILTSVDKAEAGIAAILLVGAVATGLLIFNGIVNRPKATHNVDGIWTASVSWQNSESEQEDQRYIWNIGHNSGDENFNKAKKNKGYIISMMWMVLAAVYFFISFATMAWYVTWVVFFIGIALTHLINLIFYSRYSEMINNPKRKIIGHICSVVWMLTIVVYFLLSFATGAWYITWIIFFIGGALSQLSILIFQNFLNMDRR